MTFSFLNSLHNEQFWRDGYIVVPFLSLAEVEELKTIYSHLPASVEPFHSTSFYPDWDFKNELDSKIKSVVSPKVNDLISGYKSLGSGFLTKKNTDSSIMPIHQDWTVVDENQYFSATIWIPLQDTDAKNGAIQVISGSHRFSDALRSPSLEVSFNGIYEQLKPLLKLLPMKAGEAFIFNHALMHASPPNISANSRIAATFGFVPEEAKMRMYYQKEGSKVERFDMPDDMFIRYPEIRQEPLIGSLAEELNYKVPALSMKEVKEKQKQYFNSIKMKPLFKSAEHQNFFEENGYLLLPALNAEEVEVLKNFYTEIGLKDDKGYGFHVGMDNPDKNIVTRMVEKVKGVALPRIQDYFGEVQLFTASYVVKDPNPQGVVPPHQDWSFVDDEQNYCSVTCWIPLQDVNIENGCMAVVKGSNRFFNSPRPSPSPQVGTPLKNHMFTIFPYMQLLEMKAGEALIFDNRTFHASPPNTTSEARLAVGLGFTQKEASVSHYALKPGTEDTLLKYKIDPEFFMKYDNSSLSKMYDTGEFIKGYGEPEEIPYVWEDLTAEEFKTKIKDAGNVFNVELVEKLATLFNYNIDGSQKQAENQQPVAVEAENTIPLPVWKVYSPANILREIKYRLTGS